MTTKRLQVTLVDYLPIGNVSFTTSDPFLELRIEDTLIHWTLDRATQSEHLSIVPLNLPFACKVWIALIDRLEAQEDAEEIADLFASGDLTIAIDD